MVTDSCIAVQYIYSSYWLKKQNKTTFTIEFRIILITVSSGILPLPSLFQSLTCYHREWRLQSQGQDDSTLSSPSALYWDEPL